MPSAGVNRIQPAGFVGMSIYGASFGVDDFPESPGSAAYENTSGKSVLVTGQDFGVQQGMHRAQAAQEAFSNFNLAGAQKIDPKLFANNGREALKTFAGNAEGKAKGW